MLAIFMKKRFLIILLIFISLPAFAETEFVSVGTSVFIQNSENLNAITCGFSHTYIMKESPLAIQLRDGMMFSENSMAISIGLYYGYAFNPIRINKSFIYIILNFGGDFTGIDYGESEKNLLTFGPGIDIKYVYKATKKFNNYVSVYYRYGSFLKTEKFIAGNAIAISTGIVYLR